MAFVLVVHFWALTVGFLCRYQSLESTIPNAGLRRTCWRSKERGREPTTRKKAWWVLFLNWMLKVMVSFKMRFQLQHCHFLLCLALNLLLLSSIILVCADVDALLKKSESQHEPPEDGCPFGPLTQRLLQALVEVRELPLTTIFISINLSTNLSINPNYSFPTEKSTILLKNILLNQINSKFLWNPFLKQK